MAKTLVAYFSASGQTARLAQTVAKVTGGDLFSILPAQPYTAEDLDWREQNSRSTLEMRNPDARPSVVSRVQNMEEYDTIYLGFPVWWYTAPRIVQTFLKSYDLAGKTIVPFVTSGGSGYGKTNALLERSCPGAALKKGTRLASNASEPDVRAWVASV